LLPTVGFSKRACRSVRADTSEAIALLRAWRSSKIRPDVKLASVAEEGSAKPVIFVLRA